MSKFDELVESSSVRAKAQQIARDKAIELVKPALAEFMAANPGIKGFAWSQYTPYFNDGSPCIFGIYGYYYTTDQAQADEGEWSDWREVYAGYHNAENEFTLEGKAAQHLGDTLEDLSEELEYAFGGDVHVLVTQQGVEVSEYGDHD